MRIIAGEARSRTIEAPKGRDTRPTLDRVRENLFNILQNHVAYSTVLDLFAGSGALSLEAISRGAKSAVLVDHDREANRVEIKNMQNLHFEDRMRILRSDWQAAVAQLTREGCTFDLVFLDPPYEMHDLSGVTQAIKPLLAPHALLITEHQAEKPYAVAEGYVQTDRRKYGYCGITIYQRKEENEAAE